MRRKITVRVGQGEKQKMVEAILWIDEIPPECRRGKNRRMKNRKFKRQRMQSQVEEEFCGRTNRSGVPDSGGRDLGTMASR